MANLHRGEIEADLAGRKFVLCLTLGALAELEASFGESDLVSLVSRFENGRLSARDLVKIIGCGLRGGGNAISDAELATFSVADGLQGYVSIAARLLAAAFGASAEGDNSAFPPRPQDPMT